MSATAVAGLPKAMWGTALPQLRPRRVRPAWPSAAAIRQLSGGARVASAATGFAPSNRPAVDASGTPFNTTFQFSIPDKVGALDEVLGLLRRQGVSLTRIESRPARGRRGHYDIYIDFAAGSAVEVGRLRNALAGLASVDEINVVAGDSDVAGLDYRHVPWFPRKIADLDKFGDKVLSYGEELDADHPGFKDPKYRERRAEITAIARSYRQYVEHPVLIGPLTQPALCNAMYSGMQLPYIKYTDEEIKTWGVVFDKVSALYPTHACKEHRYIFPLLVSNCGYRRDNIPQLEDVSRFIKDCTGWTIRPVMGLLSSRDFLNGLAFRVFHSTQYIRHHSVPLYTPEPDVCHELLGHVPLYADP
ncbi:hypothetical protein HK405_005658, partial [Cladochytrium tenue]